MAVSTSSSSSSSSLSLCFVRPTGGRCTNLPVRHQWVMKGFQTCTLNLDKRSRRRRLNHVVKAIEQEEGNVKKESQEEEEAAAAAEESSSSSSSVDELGREMKEARKAMEEDKEGSWWSGVVEEIREIEWPAFGKVVGTTGVVLGVIAGSSVVLLTVNALLAELSDRVFVGRGVQDFFG